MPTRSPIALLTGLLLAAVALATPSPVYADSPAAYPAVPPPTNPDALGRGVQRTMTLLATSTAKKRNKVRVLFYGQSITEQSWSKAVADDLRRRFPDADLEIENRAIGGFAAQLLVRPAEHDLYPFYPDLLIFHVYGSNNEYEEIIRNVRSRTTAEVLMQTDHVTKWPPEKSDPNGDKGAWWDDLMNRQLLPDIARKYGCGLVDNHTEWLKYLKANNLQPQDLLKDGVHLNDHGNYLMAELVKRYLVHRPDLPNDDWKGLVRDYDVGKDVQWKDGKLRLEFEGNRLELTDAGQPELSAAGYVLITIDGRKPSETPGCYAISRPQPGPWSPRALTRVDHDRPLVAEEWTLTVRDVADDSKTFTFDVSGSKTGPDGNGSSDKPFVSNSGRVKIDPQAWFGNGKLTAGYAIKWKSYLIGNDAWGASDLAPVVAQGLPNGRHVLEMTDRRAAGRVRTVRVYRPPVAAQEP